MSDIASENISPPGEPYFQSGLWAREGGVFWKWAIDIAVRRNPAARHIVLVQDGVVLGGIVRQFSKESAT